MSSDILLPLITFKTGPRFNSCSSRDIRVATISSALQKAVRRGIEMDAQSAVVEWLGFIDWKESKHHKAVLSNLRNRACQITPWEDCMTFVQPWLTLRVKTLFDQWESQGRTLESGRYVLQAIQLLCRARKLRVASDIRAHYSQCLPVCDPPNPQEYLQKKQQALLKFVSLLHERSTDCFVPLFEVLQMAAFKSSANCKTERKQQIAIWKRLWLPLQQLCPGAYKELMLLSEALFFQFPERKERFLYPVHAILSIIHEQCIESGPPVNFVEPVLLNESEWLQLIRAHRLASAPVFPKYVYDMHTPEGQKYNMGPREFATEGCVVIPEDQEFFQSEWRASYMSRKETEAVAKDQKQKNKKIKKQTVDSESESDSSAEIIKLCNKRKPSFASAAAASGGRVTKRKVNQIKFESELIVQVITAKSFTRLLLDGILSLSLLERLREKSWIGQTVTASWKQCVLLDQDYVYKGPYDISIAETALRLESGRRRYAAFQELGIRVPACQWLLQEADTTAGSPSTIVWMRFEQISDVPMQNWIGEESKEMRNGQRGRVVLRSSLGFENGKGITREQWRAHPEAAANAMLILAVRYVMDPPVGDSGLHAVLVRFSDFAVFNIDFEEERHLDEESIQQGGLKKGERQGWNWTLPLMFSRVLTKEDKLAFERILGLRDHVSNTETIDEEWNNKIQWKSKWTEIKHKLSASSISYSAERIVYIDKCFQ